MKHRLLALMCAAAAAACSDTRDPREDSCLALVREYQAAMPDAMICDPGVAAACAAGRPLIVSEQTPDGTVALRGLCMPPCLGAVNPARTGPLDLVLSRFFAQGCTLGACWCPQPASMPPTCMQNGVCWGLGPE